jgi:bifunctional isochorismate lyase / aryl carrier protein
MRREAFYTPETIDAQAAELLASLDDYRRPVPVSLDPASTALVVLDAQRWFTEPESRAFVPAAPAILPRVNALTAALVNVYRTRHLNTPQDAGMMAEWWRALIRREDPLSELDPRLASVNAVLIEKTQYDAFHGTDLEQRLRRRGVETLILCGMMTHLCVETSARAAFVRGFRVVIPVDAVATYNEELQRASLLTLAHGCAGLTTVRRLAETLR